MAINRISALLVVHDGATWLPEVVASIASQTLPADLILAIDTGSIDSSAKLLKGAKIPTVTLDRTTSFAEAINYGLSQLPASVNGVDEWLWILHDDCSLDSRALEELINGVSERPNIAMVGPKLLGWHDRTHLLEAGISIATNGSRWTGLEPHEYDQGQHDGSHEVLAVSTAGALIRREVFEELGGFDTNLELFRDDVDFGWRIHAAGHSALVVTSAIGYHAQAAATERRGIDIAGAPLHRPLLLDRRNAAYVLLANSSWWKLPLLAIQLLSGALIRSVAFLFAKLPGYASDEILAIASLLIHPGELLTARKIRRNQRLVSSGIVARFIPSRWDQLRSGISRGFERIRESVFPEDIDDASSIISELEVSEEDEEILKPLVSNTWRSLFLKPFILTFTFMTILVIVWMRYRFGTISGGALAISQGGASDLWKLYVESWHPVGMGSGAEAPSWIFILALISTVTFGNVSLAVGVLFFAAPFLALWSAHSYLKGLTTNSALSAVMAFLYALSPVSIAAINSGRLGVLLLIIALPLLLRIWGSWEYIEERSLRSIFAVSLFLWAILAFNPSLFIPLIIFTLVYISKDYLYFAKNPRDPLFLTRALRRSLLLVMPFLLLAPNSLSFLTNPSQLLVEIGVPQDGGGANLALLANPGGLGSLPWWVISPITLLLLVTYFSISESRKYSVIGISFLLLGTVLAALRVTGNGSTSSQQVFSGALIAVASLFAVVAATIAFDGVRARLENTHLNYQHFIVALVLVLSLTYSVTSSLWIFTASANSPLAHKTEDVLPAYLTVEEEAKILVIRPLTNNGHTSLAYAISRGEGIKLGEADIATKLSGSLISAVEGLIDNTGVTSSRVFAAHGVKYVFVRKNVNKDLIQVIDGLGGFSRTSSTEEGTVWKVNEPTGRYLYTDLAGKVTVLDTALGSAVAPGPGTITLTENFSSSWQALFEGVPLERTINDYGLPRFEVTSAGEIDFLHDGTGRRAWISFFLIVLVTSIVMALPSGRRRREMLDRELA
jgi:glycosyltransferase involved in cell wall biosynthesis